MERELPKIGTAVYIRKEGKVLLGLRNSKRGNLTWCVPGGHLEMFETLEECVHRETMEEASVEIENVRFQRYQSVRIGLGRTNHAKVFYYQAL